MNAFTRFPDRSAAGRALAERLVALAVDPPPVVLALPRGGVPVAAEVARALHAPLDLLMVSKIGVPGQPEVALGALVDGEQADIVINPSLERYVPRWVDYLAQQKALALREIARRRALYVADRPPVAVGGRTVIVVDDGIATGATMRAALRALRGRSPARLVLAVPVAPHEALDGLRGLADDIVCLAEPVPFQAVGLHYADYHPVADGEVLAALSRAGAAPPAPSRRLS